MILDHDERNTLALAAMLLEEVDPPGNDCREAAARLQALLRDATPKADETPPVADGWERATVDRLRTAIELACEGKVAEAHQAFCGLAGELALEGRSLDRDFVAFELRGLARELDQ